jgi:hypothetical protein
MKKFFGKIDLSASMFSKRNSVKRESAMFSFFTDGNSGMHKRVVCTTLS